MAAYTQPKNALYTKIARTALARPARARPPDRPRPHPPSSVLEEELEVLLRQLAKGGRVAAHGPLEHETLLILQP